jgi:UDP-N-acetylglucosamine 1-carboxyvinyltransferase
LRGFRVTVTHREGGLILKGFPKAGRFALEDRVAGVSATCLAILIGATLRDESLIRDVSREPEVYDLIDCVTRFGARANINGHDLTVRGPLHSGGRYELAIDPTYVGTIAFAASLTEGDVTIRIDDLARLQPLVEVLESTQIDMIRTNDRLRVIGRPSQPLVVETGAFPAFPSDLLPPLTSLATSVRGRSVVRESVYESRFDHVPGLVALGAQIQVDRNTATIIGGRNLKGATITGSGIRETAALVLAALTADGKTTIHGANALFRGYEDLPAILNSLGAKISRCAKT